jgi:hypothetical protein
MADASACLAIRRFSVTNAGWTPIVTPLNCNAFSLSEAAGKAFLLSSDPSNPEAWEQVAVGNGYALQRSAPSFPLAWNSSGARFAAGSTILYAQAVDGDGATIVADFGL